jgi:hypothetical protein
VKRAIPRKPWEDSRRRLIFGAAFTALGCGGANPFLIPYIQRRRIEDSAEYCLMRNDGRESRRNCLQQVGLHDLAGVDRMLNAGLVRSDAVMTTRKGWILKCAH